MSTISPPSATSAVLPVSELNRRVRDLLESSVPLLWVSGEISNFTRATSGHWYFSLKDASAQVRCVMFRHKSQSLDWVPQNGMQVEARALVTLYEPRGDYQLNIEMLRRAGLGALYERFERLKAMLAAEGLFEESRKKPLPNFPKTIGIITSTVGAALHDVLTTLRRRSPSTSVIVYPTQVQGEGIAVKIAEVIRTANSRNECEVIILCRGGGSIEDLWQFNEEIVARAIVASTIPIVSGVGHETDFTIADFVADKRAPTPTAAAEMVSANHRELLRHLHALQTRLRRFIFSSLEANMQYLDNLARRLIHPQERLTRQTEHLRQLSKQLARHMQSNLQSHEWRLGGLAIRLNAIRPNISAHIVHQQALQQRLKLAIQRTLEKTESKLNAIQAEISHLNPEAVLDRGYSIVTKDDGTIVQNVDQIVVKDNVSIRFSRGIAEGMITGKRKSREINK